MDEDARAENPAAEDNFAAVMFLSLAGLDLSSGLAAKGAFADWLLASRVAGAPSYPAAAHSKLLYCRRDRTAPGFVLRSPSLKTHMAADPAIAYIATKMPIVSQSISACRQSENSPDHSDPRRYGRVNAFTGWANFILPSRNWPDHGCR